MTHWNRFDIKNVTDQKQNKSDPKKMLYFEKKLDTLSVHNAMDVTLD